MVSTHDLSQPNAFALIYGMEPFHGRTAPGHPDPQKHCLWAGHAAGDGPWPAGAGAPPSHDNIRNILHRHGINGASILGDLRNWTASRQADAQGQAIPCIIHLAGEYHAWSHWSDGRTTLDGACVLASAAVTLIACGAGGCRAILICHERGHIWAEAGPDMERRMHKILGTAKQTLNAAQRNAVQQSPGQQSSSSSAQPAADSGRPAQ